MLVPTRRSVLVAAPALAAATLIQAGLPARPAMAAPYGMNRLRENVARLPDLAFTDAEGRPKTMADFAGRGVLINLWATWCPPCVAEMPALDRYAARTRGQVNVVVVSQDIEGWRAVNKFFRPGRFRTLATYLDQPTDLALAYQATGLPVTVAYNASGRELWRVNGPIEWDRVLLPLS